jgi:hypothetical protein
MNIVMLTLSLGLIMHLRAADRNAISYNEARSLPSLTQPLPPYPWDESATEQFIADFNPSCFGLCSSVALPIPDGIPCSLTQFITRMQNHGCTATSCCQCAGCISGTAMVIDVGAIVCSSGPIAPVVGYLAAVSLSAFVSTIFLSTSCVRGFNPWTYKLDRDFRRSAITFYSMHAQAAQERQPLLAQPIPIAEITVRDAVDEHS